jgi:hypothetical protein
MIFKTILVLAGILLTASHAPAVQDWDPFTNNQEPSGIPTPRVLREEQNQEHFSPPPNRWREDKDQYEVRLPLRLPDDADPKFMTYKYSDGELKVVVPKKKLKSII